MIIEPHNIDGDKIIKADLCLIGSGPASLTILDALKDLNLKIIIIPGGKFSFNKKNQKLYKGIIDEGSSHEPLTENRFREFGGSGNYWGGRCVPLDEIDFIKKKWIKNSGWPIKFSDFIKYYQEASKFLNISLYDKRKNFFTKNLKEIIKKMDDRYLTSKKLESWSPILNFKKKFLKIIKKDNIIVIDNSHLIKINTDNKKVTTINCKVDNQTFKIRSHKYVLACGGIENPRILLNSKNKFHPKGIGNANDLVGRFYMSHHAGIFLNLNPFNRKNIFYNYLKDSNGIYQRSRWWLNDKFQKKKRVGNAIFFLSYTANSKDMGAQGRLFELVKLSKQIISNKKNIFNFKIIKQIIKILFNLSIIRYAVMYSYLRLKKNRIPSVLPDLNSKYFGIYHQIEQTPCYNSQIKLDKKKDILGQQLVKLNLRFNSIDFKTVLKSHEYLIKRIKILKIGDLQKKYNKKILMQLFKNRINNNFNSMAHHIGTTRMGSSNKNGVVDKNCKVFGINNLFIAGSSVFPTSGHANPTFTIVALSLRLSKLLKKIYNVKKI
jgi:choline dehydrogenase-like flavoprotein